MLYPLPTKTNISCPSTYRFVPEYIGADFSFTKRIIIWDAFSDDDNFMSRDYASAFVGKDQRRQARIEARIEKKAARINMMKARANRK